MQAGGPRTHRSLATVPRTGVGFAFAVEVVITFILMTAVLTATNRQRFARYTGVIAGTLIALYVALLKPVGVNPARSFSTALPLGLWEMLWVYLTAPLVGMLLAAEVYVRRHGPRSVHCAKLNHQTERRCIFRCGYRAGETNDP